jgi:hypothetical protein
VLGGQTLDPLLEGDAKELPCLVQPLVGHWVWHVGDVLQMASGGCHAVGHVGET